MLFLCTHNAGSSPMALGFFTHLAGERALGWSGGSETGDQLNSSAVAAMHERGIDIAAEFPKPWTDEIIQAADVVVTMGCGDACPIFPGRRYQEWVLDDPAGKDIAAVRAIRVDIESRVRDLLTELDIHAARHRLEPPPTPRLRRLRARIRNRHNEPVGLQSVQWLVSRSHL